MTGGLTAKDERCLKHWIDEVRQEPIGTLPGLELFGKDEGVNQDVNLLLAIQSL